MMPTDTDPRLTPYRNHLEQLAREGQLRRCRRVEPEPSVPGGEVEGSHLHVRVEGQSAINFSSNDYLGLSRDRRLQEAAMDAIRRYGTGSAASRLISGTNDLVLALERAIADFKDSEAALVFNSGYQANLSILQAILSPGDWVFCDKFNHASLVDGCRLSGARWSRYRHLDLTQLESKLKKAPANVRRWIVTDSVFSMDGDYPDLLALADIAERYGALILVDEAHATGLYGERRHSGLCEQFEVSHRIALQMGTFSKALGGSGAYVAGSAILIQTLTNQARGFIYSTAMSPGVVGAALRAVEVVQADSRLQSRLWRNVARFEQLLQEAGLSGQVKLPVQSPIIPIVLGDSAKAMQVSQALLDAGYFVQGIRPPTVPPGAARIRVTLSAAHTDEHLTGLVRALSQTIDQASADRSMGETASAEV